MGEWGIRTATFHRPLACNPPLCRWLCLGPNLRQPAYVNGACCRPQERLEAAAAAAAERQDSPARSGASTQLPGGDLDAERRLERRLAAKQREAEAAAAALAAAQQQVAAREAEVEAERRRAAELADELAHSRDDALKVSGWLAVGWLGGIASVPCLIY